MFAGGDEEFYGKIPSSSAPANLREISDPAPGPNILYFVFITDHAKRSWSETLCCFAYHGMLFFLEFPGRQWVWSGIGKHFQIRTDS
jgi:hypothetical protein